MENLKDLSIADLDVLHQQMLKEQGYAGTGRAEWYAGRIAEIVNEKNSRLPNDMRANVSGGVVPAIHDEVGAGREAEASAEVLRQAGDGGDREGRAEKVEVDDPHQDTPTQQKKADVNKASGSGVADEKEGTPASKPHK